MPAQQEWPGQHPHSAPDERLDEGRVRFRPGPSTSAPRRQGPKGYRRSDARIEEDIVDRLRRADHVDCEDVSLRVQDGIVTLEGTVPERWMKHTIEDLASDCAGVQDVDNRIRVQRPQQERSETRGQGTESGAAAGRTRQGP